ncbi:hypothetical protein [Pseudonocardia yunnanensis]|uniref:Uncharacterized protein n=1 Tax=Pseudonocardia yunnanensis TaxID=58107 RepID=A0ABW4EQ40_9PSEU
MPKEIFVAFGVDAGVVAGWPQAPADATDAGPDHRTINGHDGVRSATFDEIADDYLRRFPRS